jgi:sigma-E factor negative regulatory protein RseC
MDEIGVVVRTEGRFATVSVPKKAGICEQCTMGTCHVSEEGSEIDALNKANAKEGQKVRVSIKPYTYVKGSLIVYGIPVLCLMAGAVLGQEFLAGVGPFAGMDPEYVSAISGFSGFILSFIIIKLWSMKAEKRLEFKPVIEEILDEKI